MNLALRKPMTLAEFLAWEERQPLRYEFDGIGPVAMTGGTFAHAAIQRNLALSIGGRLRGQPCQFVGNDLKIQVADGHIRYPDGMVVCTTVDPKATVARDPVVVFEVLSRARRRTIGSSRRANIRRRRRSGATSCWSRTASARPFTPAPATCGRTTS